MSRKKELGQFYTTRWEYILHGMSIPKNVSRIVEPFVGSGELLQFIEKDTCLNNIQIDLYDIDPPTPYISCFHKHCKIHKQDTLFQPPDYTNSFVLTNPPYVARNKYSGTKTLFSHYKTNDMYKCFIQTLIIGNACGGIIIIPLNFWSSIRANDISLRKHFLKQYSVQRVNVFEEPVFEDTSYTICSVQFEKSDITGSSTNTSEIVLPFFIYPSTIEKKIAIYKDSGIIGGELYTLGTSRIKVKRLTKLTVSKKNTNLIVHCIDTSQPIHMQWTENVYIDNTPNLSCRSFLTPIIEPAITEQQQHELVLLFNNFINENRTKYHSLFLTNYRENGRKRISFELIYTIISYLLET